jgi:Protein of unknown function (DUF4446)
VTASVAGWIAIAAAVVAVIGLTIAIVLHLRLRRVRAAQLTLQGSGGGDLVDFAVSLQGRVDGLHRALDEVTASLGHLERRLDSAVSRLAVVRYDAYEQTGGHQSASVALLDASRTGVVLSAIQGRDYARIYVKELDAGRAAVSLSPEEQEAVERAMRAQQ